jgi:hypothetical protein
MIISSQLAKRLKEAGYPQEMYEGRKMLVFEEGKDPEDPKAEYVYFPTLPEMIAACGEDFYDLVRIKDEKGVAWCAQSARPYTGVKGYGSIAVASPEEALAELYIAIHSR